MGIFKNQTKQETIIYTIVWIILFMVPIVELLVNYDSEHPIWLKRELLGTFLSLILFLVVFLIHNHILAPMLIYHKKVYQYIACCVVVVALFQTVQCARHPIGPTPPEMIGKASGESGSPDKPILSPPHGKPPINWHDMSMFTIIIMMLGANLGVKIYFRSEEEKKHLAKLKEQSLKQELEYLRYQINPHFIMNTLNNIHALVDIDPEQAKDSIVDMSRMMRYLLYDSDNHCVSLNSAIIFLKKYLNLMKLRYMDTVNINLDVPSSCSEDVALVPLVFIPFVENAFKHGVGIGKPSTIDISIEHKDSRLLFHCRNTKSHAKHEYGGVGLNNVTKRLELIYGSDYSLDISDEAGSYDVRLELPAKCPEDFKPHTDPDNKND